MGANPHPLLVSLHLKGMVHGNKEKSNSSGSLWGKVLEAQAKGRCKGSRKLVKSKRPRRILMKRRASPEGSRRPANGIKRRLRTLKKIVPNGDTMELDGLLTETADYILSLQMRVEVMQIMVKVLTGCDE